MARPARTLISPREVGDLNRAAVLRALVDRGPLSRSDLARVANVTRSSVGTIVQGLIDDGVLLEGEPVELGRIGKPARPVWFADGAGTVVAVELTADAVRATSVDATGALGKLVSVALRRPDDPASVVRATTQAVRKVRTSAPPLGIGIAVPGSCDSASGEVIGSHQVPGARGLGLAASVAEATELAVHVENDSRAQAMAEHWFGAGRGHRTFVSLQTGHGIGAGLLLDGHLDTGATGRSGEVGHIPVVIDGDLCACGLRGCWETIATLGWLRTEAAAAGLPGARTLTSVELAQLVASERKGADAVAQAYAEHLAVGLAALQHVLDPEVVILHGDVVGGGEPFRRRLEQACHRRTLLPIPILLSPLEQPTLLGAAARVLTDALHLSAA